MNQPRPAAKRFIMAALLLSLLATALLQQFVQQQRRTLLAAHGSGGSDISSMNSYALALVLGGLRGPLVMALWTSSESQKSHHQLEDFDTKIEWIRQLQPEFDSVSIYEIWNLAYNKSQQMASLSNKYAAVLDGLDYAHKVMAQRPNNINLFSSVADVYFYKLGSSSEREFYAQRVRRESFASIRIDMPASDVQKFLTAAARAGIDGSLYSVSTNPTAGTATVVMDKVTAQTVQPTFAGDGITYTPMAAGAHLRGRLDVMLDMDGNIVADQVTPQVAAPPGGGEYLDGSELQFLKRYEPFPYGLPPLGLGWNYYKRAQVLQATTGQQHLQMTEQVIDSRPPITMKLWAEGEIREGLEHEAQGLGRFEALDEDKESLGLVTAAAPVTARVTLPDMLDQAIYHYTLAARVAADAEEEFARNLHFYAINTQLYASHRQELAAEKATTLADADYLHALLAPAAQRQPFIDAARTAYQHAALQWEVMILKYGPDEQTAAQLYPRGVTQDRLADLTPDQLAWILNRYHQMIHTTGVDTNSTERLSWEQHLQRCLQRLGQLGR